MVWVHSCHVSRTQSLTHYRAVSQYPGVGVECASLMPWGIKWGFHIMFFEWFCWSWIAKYNCKLIKVPFFPLKIAPLVFVLFQPWCTALCDSTLLHGLCNWQATVCSSLPLVIRSSVYQHDQAGKSIVTSWQCFVLAMKFRLLLWKPRHLTSAISFWPDVIGLNG